MLEIFLQGNHYPIRVHEAAEHTCTNLETRCPCFKSSVILGCKTCCVDGTDDVIDNHSSYHKTRIVEHIIGRDS